MVRIAIESHRWIRNKSVNKFLALNFLNNMLIIIIT